MRRTALSAALLVPALLVAAWLVGASAAADVVSLGAVRDTTLFEEDGSLSNGAGDYVFAGATKDAFVRRALLAFDVASAVPPGSTVNAATLTLYLSRTRTGGETMTLHRVLADWGEGTSHASGEEGAGAPATANDATWTQRRWPSTPWATPGGDFEPLPSGSAVVSNQSGYYSWSTAGMAADVQAWVDGTASDHGWILLGNEVDTRVAKRFESRNTPDVARRPQLVIDFTPPAATGACCEADGSCGVVLDPGGACGGAYQGEGTSCEPNLCPQPAGACCLPTAQATCQEETADACTALGGTFQGEFTQCAVTQCPVVLTPFLDPLPRPAVAQPVTGSPGGAATYEMSMREVQQQLHSELPPTTVWGFGDGPAGASYPGPTLEAAVGEPVQVTWRNDLRDTAAGGSPPPLRTSHYLPVDVCPHGAAENADARTVVHLHGGHVSEHADGHPDATFPPGDEVVYDYPNEQLPATLWYHDHALGITRLNVQMGLAGFYLLRDPFEQGLGLPSGPYEVPLAIQDRKFNPDGSLRYPAVWQDMFFGDTVLVNGKAWPYLEVDQGKYRLRLLNGASSRTWRLSLSSGDPFHVIGMEGGLLPAPVPVAQVTLGPGERADVVVDFAGHAAGTEILLQNDAPAPFPGDPGVGVLPEVMKFVVQGQAGHTDPLPASLRPMETLLESEADVFRELHLEKGPGDACSPFLWEIRSIVAGSVVGSKWVDVTEMPQLGDTEVWSFVNKSGVTHPMHMHLVMFQVLDRQAFELVGGVVTPIGSPVPPPAHEAGWKDTVQVGPNEIVRVIARFANPLDETAPTFTGLFPYHCHILEHEDHEMMRQFQAVTACGDGIQGQPAEACDDGNTDADDGCSPTCQVEAECQDGLDNDGDGLVDTDDPGCTSAADFLESNPAQPCDDGLDNDGDGWTDYKADGSGDPGCLNVGWSREDPACQDGVNNDNQLGTDFDGGVSVLGAGNGDPNGPDPQCVDQPWRASEAPKRCGLGAELVLLLPVLAGLRRLRRASRPRAAA